MKSPLSPYDPSRRALAHAALLSLFASAAGCGLGDVGHDPVKLKQYEEKLAADTDDSGSSQDVQTDDAAGQTGDSSDATDSVGTTDAGGPTGDGAGPGQDSLVADDAAAADGSSIDAGGPIDVAQCQTDKDCDDSNACTVGEACSAAKVCLPATATVCDDGDPCTKDTCDPTKGCMFDAPGADGLTCSDGNACTVGDACGKGACLPGAATSCDDGNVCTKDACLPASGCTVTTVELHHSVCDDSNKCSGSSLASGASPPLHDYCEVGVCKAGIAVDCDDNDPCTKDSCDPKKGCVYAVTPNAPCDDGEVCTETSSCDKTGQCVAGKKKDCDDKSSCTIDDCKTGKGCVHAAQNEGKACDDNNVCTGKSACAKGKCVGSDDKVCKVTKQCQTWICDPVKGCIFGLAQGSGCTDNSVCTVLDLCDKGVCIPGKKKTCDDKNPCTNDSCNAKTGCVNANADGKVCDDGKDCTTVDACKSGKCVSAPSVFRTLTPVAGKAVLGLKSAIAGRSGGKFLTWQTSFRLDKYPVQISHIEQHNAGGQSLQKLQLGGAMTNPVRLVPSGNVVYAVGQTFGISGKFASNDRARVIALDDSGKLKPVFDKPVGDAGTVPKDAVEMPGGGVRIFGAIQFTNSFSEAMTVGISATGKPTAPVVIRRGAQAEFNGGTVYTKNGASYAACGRVVWSGHGHSDMWLATLSSAGKPLLERRLDFAHAESCNSLVAVDKGFVLGGESSHNELITNGHVLRVDESGRIAWSRVLGTMTGGAVARVVMQTKRVVIVGGTVTRLFAPATFSGTYVGAFDIDSGEARWDDMTDSKVAEGVFDVDVQSSGHVLLSGAREIKDGQFSITTARFGPYGATTCAQLGACIGASPTKCDDTNPCTNDVCDASKGCLNPPHTGRCNDGSECTIEGQCVGGKCKTGGLKINGRNLGKPIQWGGAVATDFEGGLVVATRSTKGTLTRLHPAAVGGQDDGAGDGRAVWTARMGGFVQTISVKEDGPEVTFGELDSGKPAQIPAGMNPLPFAQTTHFKTAESRRDAAVNGGRIAAISTAKSGTKKVVQIVVASAPEFAKDMSFNKLNESKVTWDGGKLSDLSAYAIAANPQAGFFVGVHRHVAGDSEPTSAWIRIVDSAAKLGSWLYKDEGIQGSRRKLIQGLAAAPNGDALVIISDDDSLSSKHTFHLRRIGADNAKALWTKKLDVDQQGPNPMPILGLRDGSVITALTGKKAPVTLYRVEAGTNLLIAQDFKPPFTSGTPASLTTDPGGAVILLLSAGAAVVQSMTPWLHTSCSAAGKCVVESVRTCVDNTTCTNHSCDPKTGCKAVAAGAGGACNDGDACLQSAKCSGGTCVGGKNKQCADGQQCTVDRCDPASGQCTLAFAHMTCGTPALCKMYACSKNGCNPSNAPDGLPCPNGKCKGGKCM